MGEKASEELHGFFDKMLENMFYFQHPWHPLLKQKNTYPIQVWDIWQQYIQIHVTWHLGTWFSGGLGSGKLTVGLHDALFQPKSF